MSLCMNECWQLINLFPQWVCWTSFSHRDTITGKHTWTVKAAICLHFELWSAISSDNISSPGSIRIYMVVGRWRRSVRGNDRRSVAANMTFFFPDCLMWLQDFLGNAKPSGVTLKWSPEFCEHVFRVHACDCSLLYLSVVCTTFGYC